MAMQDYVGLAVIVGVVVVVLKMAFGGNTPSDAGNNKKGVSSISADKAKAGGVRGETSAQQAWRESRETREQALRRRKQDMVDAARRRFLEQDQSQATAGSSRSSIASGQHSFAMGIASGSSTGT